MLKKKRVIASLLVVIMLMSACGQNNTPAGDDDKVTQGTIESTANSETAAEDSYFNETGYPIVNEEITLKVLTKATVSEHSWDDMADAPGWKYISELTGIKFEFETYTEQELATKIPLIMSDPDNMPDIFWQCGVGENYAEQGLILELDDYIEKYGENIKACWASNDAYQGWATYTDGHVYTLPAYNDTGVVELRNYIVNTRWMENCGIESMPTNLEEFKEMLIKFRDMDANGNGDPNDEIPLDGDYSNFVKYVEESTGMISSYPRVGVMYSHDYGSTEAYPKFTDERYRYTVEYLADLYAEGLMAQDIVTATTAEKNDRKGHDRVGVFQYLYASKPSDSFNPDEWAILPFMTSEYMPEVPEYAIVAPSFQTGMVSVSAFTEYPEVCVRLIDYFFSLEGSFLSHPAAGFDQYDFTGADISPEVLEIAEKAFNGEADFNIALAEMIGVYGGLWRAQLSEYRIPETEYASNLDKSINEMRAAYDYDDVWIGFFNNLKFTPEETEIIGLYKTDLDGYVKETLGLWLTGAEELTDEAWEEYLAQCEALHLDELTPIYQAALNRWYGVE